jgi:hypothetical protein
MAVYQSGTEPLVRRRTYTERVPYHWYEQMSEAGIARYMRKRNHIPRKASLSIETDGWDPSFQVFGFRWYEVETNA